MTTQRNATTDYEPSIYAALYARVTNHLNRFRDDLEKHDRRWMTENPDTDFIHITHDSSTHIYPLPAAPFNYQKVPYLFGQSTDEQIAEGYVKVLKDHHADDRNAIFTLCQNGRLSTITADKAVTLMRDATQRYRK